MDKIIEFGVYYVYPVLILLIVLEFLHSRDLYDWKESLSSFGIAAVSTFIASFTKVAAFGIFVFLFELFKEFRIEVLGYESLGFSWYVWIICIICDDFNFYWHHRLSHTIRLLWAAHIPHHNAATFNLTVSIRNGWFITLYKPVFWLWMAVLGFEPIMIGTCLIINATYQFFLHSQLVPSLGWYEKVFNTPYVHVVHHSSNVEYMDRNHGGIFIIWDKIFGTFQAPIKGLKAKFGVTTPPNSYNPIIANTHEFQNIWRDLKKTRSPKNWFMYIFGPPGWSHDNSSKTARQLRREWLERMEKAGQSNGVVQSEVAA